MRAEPRREADYSDRQVRAAHRVLVDVGQVLADFHDSMVVVGGWVPDLLMPGEEPKHVGSIDVDIALDAERLHSGRYAELLKLLLATGRYRRGEKLFQLVTAVDLGDGEVFVLVAVEFLAPSEVKMQRNQPKLIADFRVLQFAACAAAFQAPIDTEIKGQMISGAQNSVRLRVASLADFAIMKAHAIAKRDKPKDVYDLCYCLDAYPGGIEALAADWRARSESELVRQAIPFLREKFETVGHYGPRQLVIFHDAEGGEEEELYARRAYELVLRLVSLL